MSKIVYGLPGRDEEIAKIKQTIVNMGKLGIPVLEWNFYNHRATDGYQQVPAAAAPVIPSSSPTA